jgi:two-component system, NarL family, sensor kinase
MFKSKRNDASGDAPASLSERISQLEQDNARLVREFGRMQGHFAGLARSVWQVQEDERRRLARELHDGVGQSLTALRHRIERLPDDPGRQQSIELVAQILEDVRELSRLLRPPVLDDLGLAAALNWLGRRVRKSSDLEVSVDADCLDGTRLDQEIETLVFRIVQEALHNVVRHANASRVDVRASRAGNRIEVMISDDGRGFDPATLQSGSGIGLAGMRDRAELFGGDLTIRSRPNAGTRILLGLSLPSNHPGETSS